MAKELAKASAEFEDIKKRVGPMLENMGRLDNNFWNATSGNWNRYYSGIDMLRERLAAINAASAADPAAAADAEVKTIVAGVDKAKADCLAISKEYWTTAMRVQAVAKEVQSLKTRVDGIVKERSGLLSRSKSLPALQSLSAHLNTFKHDLNATCMAGPHKPNHPLLA